MSKRKTQNAKRKITIQNLKFLILNCGFTFFIFSFALTCLSQNTDLEFSLDVNSETTALPAIFKPNIDLSGRGYHRDMSWPQTLAAKEVLEKWQQEIGLSALYRLQYNLWEINQLGKNKEAQNKLIANYEETIKKINDSGGTVILNIFGTPAGMGKILDKKCPPLNLKIYKGLIKEIMRDLSCNKKYNVWYEIWTAPDLDSFFLGRRQDYLYLYRVAAQAKKELEEETRVHIALGGPGTSWWFQNTDGNAITTPERSLVYELIKFCYANHLPLDFISWHSYSTSPLADQENTIYKKTAVKLIRDWLTYFNFASSTPLIIDEWNFDRNANLLAERKEKSFIAASFIPARIRAMYEAGIDNQVYFSLEDFQNNKEGVVRNTGAFSFDAQRNEYKGEPKAIYNSLLLLGRLGGALYEAKIEDEFTGVIATKTSEGLAILFYNYIDPEIVNSYFSRNISTLSSSERKILLRIINSDVLEKLMVGKLDINTLRRATPKIKTLLKEAQRILGEAKKYEDQARTLKIELKNLKGDFLYQRFVIDSGCSSKCQSAAQEEKEISSAEKYSEELSLKPYSVQLVLLKQKPKTEVVE